MAIKKYYDSDCNLIVKYSHYMVSPLWVGLYPVYIALRSTAVADKKDMLLVEAPVSYLSQHPSYAIPENDFRSIVYDIEYKHHLP